VGHQVPPVGFLPAFTGNTKLPVQAPSRTFCAGAWSARYLHVAGRNCASAAVRKGRTSIWHCLLENQCHQGNRNYREHDFGVCIHHLILLGDIEILPKPTLPDDPEQTKRFIDGEKRCGGQ
jgi:hypothetical protein